jgi:hypothetical protein
MLRTAALATVGMLGCHQACPQNGSAIMVDVCAPNSATHRVRAEGSCVETTAHPSGYARSIWFLSVFEAGACTLTVTTDDQDWSTELTVEEQSDDCFPYVVSPCTGGGAGTCRIVFGSCE